MEKKVSNYRQVYKQLLKETEQSPELRQTIIQRIEEELNKTILTFFTSFRFPVMIEDSDAIMIEEVLQNTKINENGLVLVLNSPGGSGLAAERIINVCRTYSNNNYSVIIPNMAKSAATMICFGSNKIFMSKTSELGPIDPQVSLKEGDTSRILSVHSIITSYENLFKEAVKIKSCNLDPYLQQLSRFDARDIEEFRRAMELSESIAVKYLKDGMMKKNSIKKIKEKIKPYLSPIETKSHGRPIFIEEARKCGLNIEEIDIYSELWKNIWELYIRTNFILKTNSVKVVESKTDNYIVLLG